MRTRILPLLITMLFALSLASNAAANENSKMTPGTIAVVNNPDSNDRLMNIHLIASPMKDFKRRLIAVQAGHITNNALSMSDS